MNLGDNEWIKNEILKLFIMGFSQDKIAKEVNVSVGSLNSILNEALSHNNTLELQRQIAIIVSKNRTTLKQIAANLRWKNAVKLRGLEENKVEKILDLMDIIINKNNIPPGTAADLLYSSIPYLLKNQLDPNRLEEEIQAKNNELKSIEDDIKSNSNLLEKTDAKLKAQLAKSRFTEKTLDKLSDLCQALELYNLDVSELFNLARMIEEFKKLGWNTKGILARYEQELNLESGIKKAESKIKRYEAVLEDLRRKQTDEKRKLGNYYDAFQIFNNLVESGLKPEDIFKTSYILKNNFTPENISQLIEDIETYGSIAAARVKLERDHLNENAEALKTMDTF